MCKMKRGTRWRKEVQKGSRAVAAVQGEARKSKKKTLRIMRLGREMIIMMEKKKRMDAAVLEGGEVV